MLYLSGGSHLEQDTHRSARRYLAELYSGVFQNPMPPLEKTAAGRPVLPGCFCSLTHTKRGAFCALSDRPVGVDAEDVSRCLSQALAKKILSPGELDQYGGAEDPNACLLRFWVLKEAYYKYLGTGLPGFPNRTKFDLSGPRPRLLGAAGEGLCFTLMEARGHWIGLCAERDETPVFWSGR